MDELRNYIEQKIDISEEKLMEIMSAFEKREYQKEELVIRKNQYVTQYYFIASGGVRIVIELPDKDITAWLFFENLFFTDLDALRSKLPTRSKVLAIDETLIYSIDAKKMHAFYDTFPEWQKLGRIIMEDAMLNIIESLISFQTMDAEARYLQLLKKSDAVQRVPLKQLASYLGITPNSLSRIRKNIS